MLRWLFAILVISNLLYWAAHQEPVLQALGLPHWDSAREPTRLARQVHPERLVPVAAPLPASEPEPPAASVAAAVPAIPSCLQSRALTDEQVAAVTRQLGQAGLRSDRWLDIRRELPGRWAVYMGRYTDNDLLQRKLEELRRLKLSPEELVNHAQLSPGLTLGQFDTEADAKVKLGQLQSRGVRTARVVVLKPPQVEHRLRLENLPAAVAEPLLKSVPAAAVSAGWADCSAP